MPSSILIIAHAPLAGALRACVLHVCPEVESYLHALDVQANESPEATVASARILMGLCPDASVLVLTDVFGATPCNVAQKLIEGGTTRLVAGVNLPMLLRCVSYRNESLEQLAARAVSGGMQGVMQVATTVPQNQHKRSHDQDNHDHQQ